MKRDVPLIVTAIALSMLFIGSLIVYPLNPYSFSSEAEFSGGSAEVTVFSTSPTEYGVCAYELLPGLNIGRNVYVFADSRYASITGTAFQNSFADSLTRELDLRNYRSGNGLEIKVIDADALKDLLSGTEDPAEYNIVFASGALPILAGGTFTAAVSDTVDLIRAWVNNGGMITWVYEKFGYYFAPMDPGYDKWLTDTGQPRENGAALFFGDSIINPSTSKTYAEGRTELADAISLVHNEVTNGVLAKFAEDNGILLGYAGNGYSSVSFLYNISKTGGWLIFGGGIGENTGLLEASAAQQIASGIYGADTANMFVEKGTMKGSTDVHIAGFSDPRIYVYTGFVASTYGKLHRP